ncbi:MAG: aldo/keto reductase, partial [Gemmatimonadota bacterium]
MPHRRAVTRRDFLATSSAAAVGAALGPAALAAQSPEPGALPRVRLGRTGELVPILAGGTAMPVNPRILAALVSEGITYLDTAQSYMRGKSEEQIGAFLASSGRRAGCFLVTKSGSHDPAGFASALEGSLASLRTDAVDAYFLHNLGDPQRLDAELRAAAESLKKSKKIRFFGFSSHHDNKVAAMERAAAVGFVDLIMFQYSFRDADNAPLHRAIDQCARAGIGLVAMKTQGGNSPLGAPPEWAGFNRHQAALKAIWGDERIHVVCSEMQNVQQARENAAAARRGRLGWLEEQQLRQYAAATSRQYCRGCAGLCQVQVDAPVAIADLLRFRMYSRSYGDHERA